MGKLIGMRTLKTAISLGLCMLIYILFKGLDNIITIDGNTLYSSNWNGFRFSDLYSPFFAGIAAAYSLYPSKKQSIAQAKNRVIASLLGGCIGIVLTIGYGLIGYISKNDFFTWPNLGDKYELYQYIVPYILITCGTLLVVLFGNLFNKQAAIFVGILTFISVTINPMGMIVDRYDSLVPFLGEAIFGTNRILSTVVGVLISLSVNLIRLPHKTKNKDLLFVVGIEGMLKNDYQKLKGYMNYKLNSITNEGMNVTLFTTRIPSTFMYLLDNVNINQPVVCMSGAALYDPKNQKYLYTEKIPYDVVKEIDLIMDSLDITPFKNYVYDDVLYTYIEKIDNIGEQLFYEEKKNAMYSNMILGKNEKHDDVLHYLLCVEKNEADIIIKRLEESSVKDEILIQAYDAFLNKNDVKELKFIKIYSKKISELNVLKKYTGEKNFRIVGLTTSNMADHLLLNSDIKITCSDTKIDAIRRKDYDDLFRSIPEVYYGKNYRREE